ncbi:hypothetical protein LS684_08670 [Cytobacillus spongiae]|uniref:hypothetical protein n=1 Tax=Cytobacillus spongiae TaxID=2901381 RepID=UPI001F39AEC2|nr:hypothetical protein [Cytobacillus spongiae]UII57491.1 hypothetical protein LS684_08670 [Cytobacillus spongiae]
MEIILVLNGGIFLLLAFILKQQREMLCLINELTKLPNTSSPETNNIPIKVDHEMINKVLSEKLKQVKIPVNNFPPDKKEK